MKNFITAACVCCLIAWFDGAAFACDLPAHGAADPCQADRLSPTLRRAFLPTASLPAQADRLHHRLPPRLAPARVVDAGILEQAPRIVAAPDGRVHLGAGDQAYVAGDLQGAGAFHVVRLGRPLRDPVSQEMLGREAIYLGVATLQRRGATVHAHALHRVIVHEAGQEISLGDRLLPMTLQREPQVEPHHSTVPIEALVVSALAGTVHNGQNQIVTINKGAHDRVAPGAILSVYAPRRQLPAAAAERVAPPHAIGSLTILRVFERISYGLIMHATEPVLVGDQVRAP